LANQHSERNLQDTSLKRVGKIAAARKKLELNYLHSRQNMIVWIIAVLFFDMLGKGEAGKDEG